MARSTVETLFKKNSKLESFLKKSLNDETYERVRAYESCIIVSEKENKALKYAILGDEWIYLTENPPKNVVEEVSLKDIISVDHVNDYPDFLSGEERENTQHLVVTYWTSDSKRRSIRRSKRSPRPGSAATEGDRSNASTPLGFASSHDYGNLSEDYGYITQSMSSLQVSGRPDSRGSIGSVRETKGGSKKKKRFSESLEDSFILKSLKEEREDHLLDIEENNELNLSTNSYLQKPLPKRESGKNKRLRKPSGESVKSNETISSRQGSVRPLPNLQKKNAFDTSQADQKSGITEKSELVPNNEIENPNKASLCCCFHGKNKIIPSCGHGDDTTDDYYEKKPIESMERKVPIISTEYPIKDGQPPDINIDITSDIAKGMRGSVLSVQETVQSRRSSITTLKGGNSRAGTPALEGEATRSMSLLGINQSTSDLGSSVNGLLLGTESPGERRKMVLNIYLLNLHSPMLMLIRSAWSNYLIRCTLMLYPDYEKAFRSSIVRGQQIQREKMEALFNQLKRELLNPENTMEDSFNLLNELRVATERNFALKKMFWKNTDMFLFLVNQLQHYLPKSPVNINTEHGRSQRCDELELTILLTEIMSLMFRESEIIPARIQTLKAERGRPVFDLLKVLICTPEVPEKMAAPSDSDREIDKQVLEFTKVALQAVFELFLMAKQANWGFNEGNFFNISWMVKTLEEMRTVELFVEKTIDIMMKMIRPPRTDVLSPSEAVLLYSIFSVLQTLLEYSPKIANYIKSHYHEEFKYFVQAPSIMKKLPSNYPLYNLTLSLLDKVMNMVVEAQTTLSFPKSPR
ncbi:uncharacterized protein C12orf56-like isoform X1 [Mytilus californianus]|uniref:uncharacterized protein C12orf56-like isoform X1 n=1 Tax=Mytilus californianus TaxID=6549 RepID=UPI00224641BE|nr:uncharacterized protein C12orf56-like isoform X1 [Mytilus californianus]